MPPLITMPPLAWPSLFCALLQGVLHMPSLWLPKTGRHLPPLPAQPGAGCGAMSASQPAACAAACKPAVLSTAQHSTAQHSTAAESKNEVNQTLQSIRSSRNQMLSVRRVVNTAARPRRGAAWQWRLPAPLKQPRPGRKSGACTGECRSAGRPHTCNRQMALLLENAAERYPASRRHLCSSVSV